MYPEVAEALRPMAPELQPLNPKPYTKKKTLHLHPTPQNEEEAGEEGDGVEGKGLFNVATMAKNRTLARKTGLL